MIFQPALTTAILLKRYKRFLADVTLEDGSTITVHCPNTGSMLSCSAPGSPVALSVSDNPKRKYPHTLEMIKNNDTWIGVNTARTNGLVAEAIEKGNIAEFSTVDSIRREVKVSDHSRLDLAVEHNGTTTYIEIKNCSLAVDGCAMFPDAVTARGTKHLNELSRLVAEGQKSCIFFLVQRMDADRFEPAKQIDPLYSQTLERVVGEGVQLLAYQAQVTPEKIEVIQPLPCSF